MQLRFRTNAISYMKISEEKYKSSFQRYYIGCNKERTEISGRRRNARPKTRRNPILIIPREKMKCISIWHISDSVVSTKPYKVA